MGIIQDLSWGVFQEAPRQMFEWAEIAGVDKEFADPNVFDGYPNAKVLINWKEMPCEAVE